MTSVDGATAGRTAIDVRAKRGFIDELLVVSCPSGELGECSA